MNISSVNNLNINNKSVNFNGLWGKTISKPDYDEVIAMPTLTQDAYYYPFVDESQLQIDQAVEENTSSQVVNDSYGDRQFLIRNCKVCAPLPISSYQYNAYVDFQPSQQLENKLKTVHVFLRDKFINSGFDSESQYQNSAINPSVVDAINKELNINA